MNQKNKCSICKDKRGKLSKQYCSDNEKHPNYEFDYEDNLTYLDCWNFIRQNLTEEEHQIRVNQMWDDKDRVKFEYGL